LRVPNDTRQKDQRQNESQGRNRLTAGRVLQRSRDVARGGPRVHNPAQKLEISPVWEAVPIQPAGRGRHRDTVLRRALAGADVIAAALALLLVVNIVDAGTVTLQWPVILLAPFVILASKALGLYDRDQHIVRKTTIDELPSVIYLSVLYAMTVWLAEAGLMEGSLNRPEVFALLVVSFVAFTTGRLLARALTDAATDPERCLILGNGGDAKRVRGKLESAPGVGTKIVGRVSLARITANEQHAGSTAPVGVPNALARVISDRQVDRIIIAPDGHDQDEVLDVIRVIKAMGVKVSVLPRLLEVVGSSSTYEDVDGLTLLGVRQYGVLTTSSELLKRLMDITGALVGLLLLSPLLGLLALAVKLDSRGPLFFRQRRIGRHGERFEMLKFRSMVPNADAIKHQLRDRNEVQGGLFKIADDPRITRVGRFLRRTSLDELPQLFNVLAGNMSLVGPRPLVEDEDALIEGWQRRRLAVKPGMTGMWQIFGSSRIPMEEMVKIDYLYGANWSIWLDLKILLRTVPYVLNRRGQ
jgi:exopolysaccharide biosynthesis polyprenyl glycosylphosphotransferase